MAESVLRMTCLMVDWRTYKRGCRERWAAVTLDAAVSGNTRCSFVVGDGGQGAVPARTRPARTLMSSAVSAAGGAGLSPGRVRSAGGGRRAGGAAGARPVMALRHAVTPLPVSTPRPSGNASARACRAAWRSCSYRASSQVPGARSWPASRLAPGSAAAWPGEVSRGGDRWPSFLFSRAGRSAAFGAALPVAGQRFLDAAGGRAHAEGLLDRSGQLRRAQRRVSCQLLPI